MVLLSNYNGGECAGQVGKRIDGIELIGLDERCDGRPVLCSGIVARKQCILPVQCNPLDGSLDAVVVDLDATVGQEELETALELGDV